MSKPYEFTKMLEFQVKGVIIDFTEEMLRVMRQKKISRSKLAQRLLSLYGAA